MNCLQAEEHFSAHYEDTLDYQTLQRFESHISDCQGCQQEYTLFRKSVQSSQQLPQIEPSPSFLTTLQERLAEEQRGTLSFWQRLIHLLILPKWVCGFAVVLILASASSFLYYDDLFYSDSPSNVDEFVSTRSSDSSTQFPSEIKDGYLPRRFGGSDSSFTTSTQPMQPRYILKQVSYTTSSTAGGL